MSTDSVFLTDVIIPPEDYVDMPTSARHFFLTDARSCKPELICFAGKEA